jgi:hypothetical protein
VNRTLPPPANNIEILAGDLLCTHASELLRQLACGSWEPAQKLRDAIELYSEVRIGLSMARGADEILQRVNDRDPQAMSINDWPPAPETERSVRHG